MSTRNLRRILQQREEPFPQPNDEDSDTDEEPQHLVSNANAYQELAAALESDHEVEELQSESQSESELEFEFEAEPEIEPEPEVVHKPSRGNKRRANRRQRNTFEDSEPVASTYKKPEDLTGQELSQSTSISTSETNSAAPDSDSCSDYPRKLRACDSEIKAAGVKTSRQPESFGSGGCGREHTPTMSTPSLNGGDIWLGDTELADMLLTVNASVRVNAEMRRLFGTEDIALQTNAKSTLRERLLRKAIIVEFPEYLLFPHDHGLSMSSHRDGEGNQYYTFDHSPEHQTMHRNFLNSLDVDGSIIDLDQALRHRHVEPLLQTLDKMYGLEDVNPANNLLQQIVAMLQYAAIPSFDISDRSTRLPYKYVENRPYFTALLKYAYLLSNKACHRTALEMCKMMLNLDPSDPLAVLLVVDTFALRAREFNWLVNALEYWSTENNADVMFNMVYSHALAFYHCVRKSTNPVDHSFAHELLRNAILRFPYVVCAIIKYLAPTVQRQMMNTKLYGEFAPDNINRDIAKLIEVYARLTWPRWAEPTVLTWFLDDARLMATLYDEDPTIQAKFHSLAMQQSLLFIRLPVEVHRHMCVIKPIANLVANGVDIPVVNGYTTFDPIPPLDGVDRYGYHRRTPSPSPRPTNWYAFFTSMLPFRDPGM